MEKIPFGNTKLGEAIGAAIVIFAIFSPIIVMIIFAK